MNKLAYLFLALPFVAWGQDASTTSGTREAARHVQQSTKSTNAGQSSKSQSSEKDRLSSEATKARAVVASLRRISYENTVLKPLLNDQTLVDQISVALTPLANERLSVTDPELMSQFLNQSVLLPEYIENATIDDGPWGGRKCRRVFSPPGAALQLSTSNIRRDWLQGEPPEFLQEWDEKRCELCELLNSDIFSPEARKGLVDYYHIFMTDGLMRELGVWLNTRDSP